MEERKRKLNDPYVKLMLTGVGIIGFGILLFFIIFRIDTIADGLSHLAKILRPFIIGAVFAYILTPLCNKLEELMHRHFPAKLKNRAGGIAVALSLFAGLMAIYILAILIIPQLFVSIVNLSETLPGKLDSLALRLEAMMADNEVLQSYFDTAYESVSTTFENWIKNAVIPSMGSIMGNVGSGVLSVVSTLKDIVIGIIVTAYVLASRKLFKQQGDMILNSVFSKHWSRIIRDELRYMDRMFSGFLSGKLLDSAIIGVLCYIVCSIAGIPNTLLISVIIGLTNI
ncbi:MAG: AI-2E family transporter, partial [Firmicutes bacterium]|nr:AI-2E family transporter [Bacillota bacterium]